jgi:hypothetical protein
VYRDLEAERAPLLGLVTAWCEEAAAAAEDEEEEEDAAGLLKARRAPVRAALLLAGTEGVCERDEVKLRLASIHASSLISWKDVSAQPQALANIRLEDRPERQVGSLVLYGHKKNEGCPPLMTLNEGTDATLFETLIISPRLWPCSHA